MIYFKCLFCNELFLINDTPRHDDYQNGLLYDDDCALLYRDPKLVLIPITMGKNKNGIETHVNIFFIWDCDGNWAV